MDEVTIKANRDFAVKRMAVICNMSEAAAAVLTREMSTEQITSAVNRVKNGTAKVENMKLVDVEKS